MSTPNNAGPVSLDVDFTQVDTKMPVPPAGLYDLKVHNMTREPNKDKTGFNLRIEFKTEASFVSVTSKDGKETPAGFSLFKYFPLQNKPDAKAGYDWKVGIAQFQEAATGETQAGFNSADYIGRTVRASITNRTDDERGVTADIGRLSSPE
jgi:hypothetical protein